MKFERTAATALMGVALMAAIPLLSASLLSVPGVEVPIVITVLPSSGANGNASLDAGEVKALVNKTAVPVVRLQALSGNLADMQLFFLFDDSTRSSSLGVQLLELKKFVASLPNTTQVAIGYMRNGTFALSQPFTADHAKASAALRLPESIPGANGSPYFALSDLVKHWPSKQSAGRRAVVMLTDGVDRYYGISTMDDPYVDAAMHSALKGGIQVYSIYLRGAGLYGRSMWNTTVAQSRLIEVGEETGGHAYFQDFTDPVSVAPFLSDLRQRFANQYLITIQASNQKGIQPLKLQTELPGLKIDGPSHIYVP